MFAGRDDGSKGTSGMISNLIYLLKFLLKLLVPPAVGIVLPSCRRSPRDKIKEIVAHAHEISHRYIEQHCLSRLRKFSIVYRSSAGQSRRLRQRP